MSYYKTVNGKKLDGHLIDMADGAISGVGDGRISLADAQKMLASVKDSGVYTDVEKKTMEHIRDNYQWTEAADSWFRSEIAKWAITK
jgi:hypothetical protein